MTRPDTESQGLRNIVEDALRDPQQRRLAVAGCFLEPDPAKALADMQASIEAVTKDA